MLRAEKHRGALEATSSVVAELRLEYGRAVVLKDRINTLVHFDPLPLVARVSPRPLADWLKTKLERESPPAAISGRRVHRRSRPSPRRRRDLTIVETSA